MIFSGYCPFLKAFDIDHTAVSIDAEHGLDGVHFDFVGGCVLKNQVVISQIKNPIFTSKVGHL